MLIKDSKIDDKSRKLIQTMLQKMQEELTRIVDQGNLSYFFAPVMIILSFPWNLQD